jgi:dipeptidyl aminopeptidase/acylaminoacyl peptidase
MPSACTTSAARLLALAGLVAPLAPLLAAAEPPGFTAADMMKLERLSDAQVSPDGREVAFTLTAIDLAAAKKDTDVLVAPLAGGEPRRVAASPAGASRPRWSRDGRRIAFVSTREGSAQVWAVDSRGGEPKKLTSLPGGVSGFEWIDEGRLLVTADVWPECGADPGCDARVATARKDGSSARASDDLFVRHWDTWRDERRSHLLVVPADGGQALDLTPGGDSVPPIGLGREEDWAASPDGKEACFSRKTAADEPWSTNADVFVVPTAGGEPKRVGASAGYDGSCRYSPDGSLLAWLAQARAGYEADRWELMIADRRSGAVRSLTAALDRPVESFAFSPDGRTAYFTVEDAGRTALYSVATSGAGTPRRLLAAATLADLAVLPDGRSLVATESSLTHPAEILRFASDGTGLARVTRVNDTRLARYALREGESVSYEGASGKAVQAWLVKPPSFDPARKYPLLVLVHGGPQGAWSDGWTYRWNAQVLAGAGYVVFMPNPRGSTGFGQAFTDDVNGDWGGRAYEDVMRGTDWAEALPFVERGRTAAAGASYGGYMIDWIAGHTDRFRALVTHDGVFDLVSMYGSTEELWFPEWEMGGPYWKSRESYEKWSPRNFVTAFKTPTLVVHGERDYRVPVEQGLAMFTALRRQGVPARLVTFPDENHWVLKPANSVRWYAEVIGWLDRWTKKP